MPKCEKCYNMFPTDYVEEQEKNEYLCLFCMADKDELTLIDEEKVTIVKKEDIIEAYRVFLKRMKDKMELQKFLHGEKQATKVGENG